jgi:microcystin-dependent protein
MSDSFIGQIMMFAGGYAPRNFAFCNGQTLAIAQNQALFSVLGTTYGGNGVSTFTLPDLRSRLPMHCGQGSGLSNYALAQTHGAASVALTTDQMPQHTHTLNATQEIASATVISNTVLPGQPSAGKPPDFYASQGSGQPGLTSHKLHANACSNVGGSQAHTNLMPSLGISFVICLSGIFPSRN